MYLYSALLEGATGVMDGVANAVPAQIVAIYDAITTGDLTGSLAQWKHQYSVIDAMISDGFISAVNAGLELQGVPAGAPRRPEHATGFARVFICGSIERRPHSGSLPQRGL